MRAGLGVQAIIRDAQSFDRPSAHQVFANDLRAVLGLHIAIPHSAGINDHRRPVLALIETSGLVDAHRRAKRRFLSELLKQREEFALAIACTRWARRAFRALVVTNEDVMLECGQTNILRK